jgi:transcriptional regulator with XRE-family HTH domain
MSLSIHNLCQQKGVSLPSLAERSGVDLTRLQAIYLGRWTPSAHERAKISRALDTPNDDIAWQHSTPVEHFYGPC